MRSEKEADHSSTADYRDGNRFSRQPHPRDTRGAFDDDSGTLKPAGRVLPESGKRIRIGWWAAAGLVSLCLWYLIFWALL